MNDLKPFLALFRPHWRMMGLGILLAIVTLCASIGLLSLSGWFLAASASAGLVVATRGQFNYMYPSGGVRGLSILRTAARWAERVVSHDATFRLLTDLRDRFFRALAPLTPADRGDLRDGDLLNRMVADVDTLDHLYLRLVSPLMAAIVAIAAVGILVSLFDPALAGLLVAILLALLVVLPLIFYRLGRRPGRQLGESTRGLRQQLVDFIGAQTELAVYGGTRDQRRRIVEAEQALIGAQVSLTRVTATSQALLQLLNGWTLVLMLYLAADQIGGLTPPGPLLALIAFVTLASFEALVPVAGAFQHLSHTINAAGRLRPVLEQPSTLCFGDQPWQSGPITLRGINFAYPGSPLPALEGINLTLAPGEKVALVGKTGCGKSSLLSLLSREWQPDSGTLALGDLPWFQLSESALRGEVCLVEQRVHVFSGTLRENLLLARPGADDRQLSEALSAVGLDGLLERQGLDQWLGEGGRQLSGGEARRIGLARALLHPGSVLLMDEPTEGLDDDTERRVLARLLTDRRSVLYVTHKGAGLERMDRVVQMEQGRIVAGQ
ncbi:cysteine/glutathione ABC transporter ATP-binding protein/permease CydC [Ferrimonas sediminicola]|uniref:Glutathione/L-cysteine transport system ATP-binding/permease protein CydC n=1 Tax=Ferrimonas sediminicola TaxID=2569538 RepID=A0A4U1BFV4_9GAMM|nr:cysteine/glutathione ABC transporter ATP-binding protein/permease CydC [Ferrimonas sediminicola]TKB48891.1 cysteine/glutathione ABC transporter ATP-binding protein/permease CydC [Ferrimonas sediminicola]